MIFENLEYCKDEYRTLYNKSTDELKIKQATEAVLQVVYGRFEVLRILYRLLELLRPVSKDRDHRLHREITVAKCDRLEGLVKEIYGLQRTWAQTLSDLLHRSGVPHIRSEMFFSETGSALKELIPNGTLDWYAKEYADSAIEALKGVLKVQLV